MKIHCGNGTVFLDGWLNVDVRGSGAALASERPDTVKRLITTEENYYARTRHLEEFIFKTGQSAPSIDTVCDAYGSWGALPAEDESVSEILSRQVFEHLSLTEAHCALIEAHRVLNVGGLLRLSVPDVPETLRLYRETGKDFFARHFLGTQKNVYAYHCIGWNRDSLRVFVEDHGFEFVEEEPNIHFYPAICFKWRKTGEPSKHTVQAWKAPWEYCGDQPGTALQVPDEWAVLEVGPGKNPWPRATQYVDCDQKCLQAITGLNGKCLAHVESLPEEWTGVFDFCLAAHILEHSTDPEQACRELSRVAKRGVIVCPSVYKDSMFCFHEADHKWSVLPAPPGVLRLIPLDKAWRDKVHDPLLSGWVHRMVRYADYRFGDEGHQMRRHFREVEPILDCFVRWDENCPLRCEVIR